MYLKHRFKYVFQTILQIHDFKSVFECIWKIVFELEIHPNTPKYMYLTLYFAKRDGSAESIGNRFKTILLNQELDFKKNPIAKKKIRSKKIFKKKVDIFSQIFRFFKIPTKI